MIGNGLPVQIELSPGQMNDAPMAELLLNDLPAGAEVIADKGYDADWIRDLIEIERVKQCEAMTRDALAVTEEMKDTAARYRAEAKRIFLEIEDCSLVTAEVRKTCSELLEKIAGPATMDRVLKPKKVKPVPPSNSVP